MPAVPSEVQSLCGGITVHLVSHSHVIIHVANVLSTVEHIEYFVSSNVSVIQSDEIFVVHGLFCRGVPFSVVMKFNG